MSEPDAASTQADFDALRALEADAPELERLEGLLDRFNVFQAIGFGKQETMHSQFLAFLLDPAQNHGLGDLFLRSFLRKVSESTSEVSLPQALDNADEGSLGHTAVHTEVYTGAGRIDFLLLNQAGKWAMIVENKVWTTEHSDQLGKYHRFVEKAYPRLQPLGVYLTPYGAAPSRKVDREKYRSLSYGALCGVLNGVLEDGGSALDPDVRMSIEHYVRMVRRHIVGDPEVVELCRSIYRKHQRALDLIYKHRPDTGAEIRILIERIIRSEPDLEWDSRAFGNDILRFAVREWDMPLLLTAKWTVSNRILLFEFWNHPDRLQLKLIIGPGPDHVRQGLLEMVQAHPDVFDTPHNYVDSYYDIFSRTLLGQEMYEAAGNLDTELRERWAEFLDQDLPRIEAALRAEAWIWDPIEESGPA
jgi:hypothetical protein